MINAALVVIFLLWAVVAEAACPAGSTCENYNGTIPYAATGGTTMRTPAVRATDAGINILEFGADPTGVSDSTTAIQAAIDCSFGTGTGCSSYTSGRVYCPSGQYKTTLPLFDDPPGNLRGNAAQWASGTTYSAGAAVTYLGVPWASNGNGNIGNTPSLSSTFWTLTPVAGSSFGAAPSFHGPPGVPTNAYGCAIKTTFNNAPGIYTSTGQGHTVENISVTNNLGSSSGTGYRCGLPSSGAGIAIPGGSGGASGTTLRNVRVTNFYASYLIGAVTAMVGSENLLDNVWNDNACIGLYLSSPESFTNTVLSSHICGTISYKAINGVDLRIVGGDAGPCGESGVANSFTISSVSSLTTVSTAYGPVYSFTATVSSPDSNLLTCLNGSAVSTAQSGVLTTAIDCVYNSFVVNTPHFGPVPLLLTALTVSAGVYTGTFQTLLPWTSQNFYSTTIGNTNFQTDVQAVTVLYAVEQSTQFWGGNISADGIHIESGNDPTQIFNTYQFFGAGGANSVIRNVYLNYDPAMPQNSPSHSPSSANLARYYVAQTFPSFYIVKPLLLENVNGALGTTSRIAIDVDSVSGQNFEVRHSGLFSPNIRVINQNGNTITNGGTSNCSMGYGCGVWDITPFQDTVSNSTPTQTRTQGMQSGPFWGNRPALNTTPRLTPANVTTLSGTLPAISPTSLGYPLLHGDTLYSILAWNSGTVTNTMARSAHLGYSYGQDLTTSNVTGLNWSYLGQSFVVYLCASAPTCSSNETASFNLLFPGLNIQLDNGGGRLNYLVTGVYPDLGFITVLNAQQDGTPVLLAGTKTTTYTGTTIGQQAYSITQYQ